MDSEVGQTARWGIGGETDFAAPPQGGDSVEEVVGAVNGKRSRPRPFRRLWVGEGRQTDFRFWRVTAVGSSKEVAKWRLEMKGRVRWRPSAEMAMYTSAFSRGELREERKL